MTPNDLKLGLEVCYVTIPTPFCDTPGMEVNERALRSYVRFLIDFGLDGSYAAFFAGGPPEISAP